MSEPKFTPGPWALWVDPRSGFELKTKDGSDNYHWPTDADLDLIACAPEMYALLEDIEFVLMENEGNDALLGDIALLLAKCRGEK